MLIKAGADFNLKNSFGVSALGEAEAAGHMQVCLRRFTARFQF
jgi:hypothetical protein